MKQKGISLPYALKHTTPEHKANEIGFEAVRQKEYAHKHEAPGHKATQAGLRGGDTEECPQDFSLHAALSRQYTRPHLTSQETHWESWEAVVYWDGLKARPQEPYTIGNSAKTMF